LGEGEGGAEEGQGGKSHESHLSGRRAAACFRRAGSATGTDATMVLQGE
jgi:hypothetical protein